MVAAPQSFPRGKKKPVAVAKPTDKPAAQAPHKKRKHSNAEAQAVVEEDAADEDTGADALFGKKSVARKEAEASAAAATKSTKKQTKTKKPRTEKSDDTEPKTGKDAQAAVITFKALHKGVQLLGCVRQVNDRELVISLPNKLNGVVSYAECSDEFYAHEQKQSQTQQKKRKDDTETDDSDLPELSAIFTVGQFVPCVVISAAKEAKGKQINLSLRTSVLHAELSPQSVTKGMTIVGTVSSVEDHGAIMNLGIRGLNAFVPLKELQSAEITPLVGRHMLVTVLSVNAHTLTATVTPERSQVVKSVTRGDSYTLKQLLPGMLLNVRVEDVLANGLSVNFLTFFTATVEQNHMSNPCQHGWEAGFRKGMKGRARIISIDHVSKTVTLSMAPHVVHLSVPEPTLSVGDVIEQASIERIDTGIGMLLSLQQGGAKAAATDDEDDAMDGGESATKTNWKTFVPAYVHISNVSDTHVDKLEKKYTVGQQLQCRVIGFAPFDALVNVTCKQSSLDKSVLRHADLTPGQKVSGKILAMEKWGILLEISEGVRGVVSTQHVPPFVQLKNGKGDTSGKYKVGKSVSARVLRVDLETKKTYLTMKKALMTSEVPVLASYEDATMGRVAHGYITKIAEYGVVVSFYNGVYGLVPAAVLRQAGITKLDEAYVLGQVVKAIVTRCDISKQRLMLSFNTAASAPAKTSNDAPQEKSELIGKQVTNVKILDVEATCLRVQTEGGLEGMLPYVQLTDFPRQTALVDAFVKSFSAGDVISQPLLVVSQAKDGLLTLSMKPLLLEFASKSAILPSEFDQVKQNAVLVGFVASVNATKGVFVKFLNNLTAIAPKAFLSESFVAQVEDGMFEIGETVLCHVEKVEKDKQQFVVGFHKNQALQSSLKQMPSFFQAYVKECEAAFQADAAPFAVGKTEKAEFLGVRPYGAVFALEHDDETVTVIVPGVTDSEWDEGETVKLLLVDYDFEKRVYYGATDSALVKNGSKKARKQKSRLSAGAKVAGATVIAIQATQKHVIVSFADPQEASVTQVGVVELAEFWKPSQTSSALGLEVGSPIECRVVLPALSFGKKKTPFDDLPLLIREDEQVLATKTKKTKKSADGVKEGVSLPKYTGDDLVLGKVLQGRVAVIKEHTMEIKLKTSKKCGKVSATVSIVDVDEDSEHPHPFDRFSVNMLVEGRVLAVLQKGANQRKAVSESNPANFHALSLTLRKADVEAKDSKSLVRADWSEESAGRALLRQGKSLEGVVVEQQADGLLVRLSHRIVGFLSCVELSTDLEVLRNFRQKFPVGKRVSAFVLKLDDEKKHLDLSLIRPSPTTFAPGSIVTGMVNTKVSAIKPPSIMVQLGAHSYGRVCITEALAPAQWTNDMLSKPQFAAGAFVRGVVLSSDNNNIDLSLREEAVENAAEYVKAPLAEPNVGDLVTGIVTATNAGGCFVRLNRKTTARVMLRDLSDDYIKDPQAEFPAGKLVAGRVTKKTEKGVEVSLKASMVSDDATLIKWSSLSAGMTVKGTITKVQSYGVFVMIEKSNISGLCHISEVADEKVTQPLDQIFSEGDYVKAKILKIEERRVSFGLKPSYFDGEESSSEEEDDDDESAEEEEAEAMEVDEEEADDDEEEEDSESEEETPAAKKKNVAASARASKAMEVDDEDDSSDDEEDTTAKPIEFTWDGFGNVLGQAKTDDADDSDSEDEAETATKQKKASKKAKSHNDEWIALREKELANNEQTPQSADDYERLLAVSPLSSYLWIQYMAFHVSLTEVDLARDVATRATSAVSFRDEREKLNVWMAFLTLEHDFGDEASFSRVFNRALAVNHPKRVYLHLVDLYARAQEHDDVQNTLSTMQKKFKKSKQTWIRALQYQVSEQQLDKAAETLQRSLKSLAAHKHLPVILKYGQLMYEHGELDKARTIFEGVLANYPKRIDLWNVYLDKEIKFGGRSDLVRGLFERLLSMDFSAKKMKFLFKKFLAFEEDHGDANSVEHVKQLAKDFVTQAAK